MSIGEMDLLERALELVEKENYFSAYQYLKEKKDELPSGKHPRVFYFLMCLAAGCGKTKDAVRYFQDAVEEKGKTVRMQFRFGGSLRMRKRRWRHCSLLRSIPMAYFDGTLTKKIICSWWIV